MRIFIDSSFWEDTDIERLTDNQKLVVLWLLTNPKTTRLGFIPNAEKRFQYDLKIPVQTLQETVSSCQKMFSRCNGSIFIKNFIKYQYGHGFNLQKNKFWPQLEHTVETLHPLEYQELIRYYPVFSKVENKPCAIPHTKGDTLPPSPPPTEKNSLQAMDMDMDYNSNYNKGGVGGKEPESSPVLLPPRFPRTVEEAKAHSAFVGCLPEFAATVWNQAVARGGCDARGNIIKSWRHHLACATSYERERSTKITGKPVNGSKRKSKEEMEAEFKAGREERLKHIREAMADQKFSESVIAVNKFNKEEQNER